MSEFEILSLMVDILSAVFSFGALIALICLTKSK